MFSPIMFVPSQNNISKRIMEDERHQLPHQIFKIVFHFKFSNANVLPASMIPYWLIILDIKFSVDMSMLCRSLPDLELVKESSLMSVLRWNFKANMNKMMSSSDNGQITLV